MGKTKKSMKIMQLKWPKYQKPKTKRQKYRMNETNVYKQSYFETPKINICLLLRLVIFFMNKSLICTHHSYATNTAILVFADCVTGCILVSSEKQNPLKIMHNKKRALSLSIISIALQKCQNTHHSAASLILKLMINTEASSSCVI